MLRQFSIDWTNFALSMEHYLKFMQLICVLVVTQDIRRLSMKFLILQMHYSSPMHNMLFLPSKIDQGNYGVFRQVKANLEY